MKNLITVLFGAATLLAGFPMAAAAADTAFTKVTAVKVEGDVTVKLAKQEAFVAVQQGTAYEFGCTIKTGKKAYVDLELSPKNSFRIRPDSTVVLEPVVKSSSAVNLTLKGGSVDSKLDDFPKGMNYGVQTPLAVCGAVGTSYTVSFTVDQDGTIHVSVVDNEGNVTFLGKHIKIERGGHLSPGQSLEIVLTKTPAGWVATVTFTGKPGDFIWLNLWGIRQKLLIEKNNQGVDATDATAKSFTSSCVMKIALPPYIDPLPPEDEDHGNGGLPPPPLPPVNPVTPIPSSPAGL
jgi:hypothetical protein